MKRALACVAGVLLLAAGAQAAEPPIEYELMRGSLQIGNATFELEDDPELGPDCYRYAYEAEPVGIARLFIGPLREVSRYCIVDGAVRSRYFRFMRKDREKDNFSLEFDWDAGLVRSEGGEDRALQPGMVDRLAMHQVIQRWVIERHGEPGPEELALTMVEDDRAKTYRFRIIERETVKVPAGEFETVRVERIDDPKKSTRFWLAPELGYRAVQFSQAKKGNEQFRAVLARS